VNSGCTIGIQFRNIAPGHRIQQWRKFLSSSANKANLIGFLVAEWKTPKLRDKLNDKKLYVASEESCLCITKNQWADTTFMTTEDINKKASSYIAQYPVLRTAQSALHFTSLTDLFT